VTWVGGVVAGGVVTGGVVTGDGVVVGVGPGLMYRKYAANRISMTTTAAATRTVVLLTPP
jgi:hypothetical protein